MIVGPPGEPLRAGLVINPRAWANRARPWQRRALRGAFAPLGEVVETDDAEVLPALLGRWRDEGKQIVAISGGDGTVHEVVNALLLAWAGRPLPSLMLLHGGTMGVAARSACAEAPLRQVNALGRARARGDPLHTRSMETLRVGDRVAFNFGLGLFAELPAEFDRRGARGPGAVRDLGLRTLASALVGGRLATRALSGWQGEARCDGTLLGHGRLAGLYATALDHAALLHMRGFEVADRPAGHLRVVAIDAGRLEVVRSLAPFALGLRRGVAPGVRIVATQVIELRPSGPWRYVLDGELHTASGPLRIEVGPVLEVL